MKFRKLALCMMIGVLFFNFSIIRANAAEEVNANQEQVSNPTEESTETVGIKETEESKETTEVKETEESKETTDVKETEESKETKEVKETVKIKKTEVATVKYTKSQVRLLSALIYCEARGEGYNGKLAVGIVVMNRVRSDRYPDTLKGVIYQKYQFSPVSSGSLKRALAEYDKGNFTSTTEKACIKAAKAALSGTKSITVNSKKKAFSKYLSFSGRLKGYTYRLGNHRFR